MTRVVFTDLDGSLLDRRNYSWEAANPALAWLKEHGVPLVILTSKTRAEVRHWRRVLGNAHPFAVENGGAVFVPRNYFEGPVPGAIRRDSYEIVEFGRPYAEVALGLAVASNASGCGIRAFHQMTAREVAAGCELPLDQAVLAKRREYDEPFELLDAEREGDIKAAIRDQGLRCIRGSRFYHACGNHDKADAVKLLAGLYCRLHDQHVVTIGLGDSFNDAALLLTVDVPIIVRSPDMDALLPLVPNALVTDRQGPAGWNEAVLDIFRNHKTLHAQAMV